MKAKAEDRPNAKFTDLTSTCEDETEKEEQILKQTAISINANKITGLKEYIEGYMTKYEDKLHVNNIQGLQDLFDDETDLMLETIKMQKSQVLKIK